LTQRRVYQTEYPYFITTVTVGRVCLFQAERAAELLAEIIHESCIMHQFILLAFCIIPDHVQIMVEPTERINDGWRRAYSPQQERARRVISSQRALEKARCMGNNLQQRGLSSPRCGEQHTVSCLMQSIKGTFSRAMHRGRIWQPRFYFRIVKSERQYENTFQYIRYNYQKHDLPERFGQKPYVYIYEITKTIDYL